MLRAANARTASSGAAVAAFDLARLQPPRRRTKSDEAAGSAGCGDVGAAGCGCGVGLTVGKEAGATVGVPRPLTSGIEAGCEPLMFTSVGLRLLIVNITRRNSPTAKRTPETLLIAESHP